MANLHKNAYKCSECGETEVCEQGQGPFEWWLAWQSHDALWIHPLTLKQEESMGDTTFPQVLCSQECLTKALQRYMDAMTEKVHTPA